MIAANPQQKQSTPVTWFGDPVSLKLEDYESVKRGFVKRASQCPGVLAIYEHRGPAYDLGLSDLDLIVVCDGDRLPKDAKRRLNLNLEDEHARDIYRGGPVVLTRSLFTETLLNPHWELRLLFGSEIERQDVNKEELFLAGLLNAIAQASRIMVSLAMRPHMERWPVKVTLGLLKGIRHNYAALRETDDWTPAFGNWWQRVHELRHHWFEMRDDRYARLEALTYEAIGLARETCWQANRLLKERGWLSEELGQPKFLLTPHNQVLIFAESPEEGEQVSQRLASATRSWRHVILPLFYFHQFALTLQFAGGRFKKELGELACPGIKVEVGRFFQGDFLNALRRRARLQEKHFDFLRANGFHGWGCEGEWFLLLAEPKVANTRDAKLRDRISFVRKSAQMRRLAQTLEKKLRFYTPVNPGVLRQIESKHNPLDISVVIATRNRCESLRITLQSLLVQKAISEISFEVIVVDNNSTDGTKEMIHRDFLNSGLPIRYAFEARPGKSYALNQALLIAKGKVLAFTDDDTTLDPLWLKQVHGFFQANPNATAQGRILLDPALRIPSWMDQEMLQKMAIIDCGENSCEFNIGMVGANMAVPAEVFLKIGGFREDLGPGDGRRPFGEDNELSLRMRKAGIRQIYVPQMKVYHRLEPRRLEKSYLRKISYAQGYSAMFFMEPGNSKFGYFAYQLKHMIQDMAVAALKRCSGNGDKAFRYELNSLRRIGILRGLLSSGGRL